MLKQALKKKISGNYWHYISWHRERFGLFPAILAYCKLHFNKGIGGAYFNEKKAMISLRPGTADQEVYNEIFVKNSLELELGDPSFIIDAGVHIGLASLH